MKITVEKTEAGYSVSTGEVGSNGLTAEQAMVRAVNLIAQLPLPPKEPAIPACLHCGSKDAPRFSIATKAYWIICDPEKGGCGAQMGGKPTKAEAIALWGGVK